MIKQKVHDFKTRYMKKRVTNHYTDFDIDTIEQHKVTLKNDIVYLYYSITSANIKHFDEEIQFKMINKLLDAFLEVEDFSIINTKQKEDVTSEIEYYRKRLFDLPQGDKRSHTIQLRIEELESVQRREKMDKRQTILRIQTKSKKVDGLDGKIQSVFKDFFIQPLTEIATYQHIYSVLNFEDIDTDITKTDIHNLYQINLKEFETYLITEQQKYATFFVVKDVKNLYNKNAFLSDATQLDDVYYSQINIKSVEDYSADIFLSASLDSLTRNKETLKTPSDKLKAQQDINQMEEVVTKQYNGEEKLCLFEMYFCIVADTKKELQEKVKRVTKAIKKDGIMATQSYYEQKAFFLNCLSAQQGIFAIAPIMKTIAGSYPLSSMTLKQKKGFLVGQTKEKQPVLMNMTKTDKMKTLNTTAFGMSRSGKSSSMKVLIEGCVSNGYHFLVIDPNDEYDLLAEYFGGTVISSKDFSINPHDLIVNVADSQTGLSLLDKNINRILLFYKSYNPLTDAETSVLKQLILKTYQRFNIDRTTTLEDIKDKKMPVISDVFVTLKEHVKIRKEDLNLSDVESSVFFNLEQMFHTLTTGQENVLFNQQTSNFINISHFTVFPLKDLLDNEILFKAYMFNVDNFIQQKVYQGKQKGITTIEIVDEGHRMLDEKNPDVVKRLAQSAKEFAKFNGGLWFITQNASDVFMVSKEITKHALAIISNSTYLFLFNMSDSDLNLLNEQTGNRLLTETDIAYIRTAQTRECLLLINNIIPYRFTFEPNPKSFRYYGGA